MPAAAKPVPADLREFRTRLGAKARAQYFYVALLGMRAYEPLKIDAQVRSGFPFTAFEHFLRNTALSAGDVAALCRIPARTVARRREAGRLAPDESDRLLRASRVFGRALELFEGNPDDARAWLQAEQPLLGNRVPLRLAATDVGALEVERLIGRLAHGIPA